MCVEMACGAFKMGWLRMGREEKKTMLFRLFSPNNEVKNEKNFLLLRKTKAWQLGICLIIRAHVLKEIFYNFLVLKSDFTKDLGVYKLACEGTLNRMVVWFDVCGFISKWCCAHTTAAVNWIMLSLLSQDIVCFCCRIWLFLQSFFHVRFLV